jgi:hypothetical protein
MLGNGAHRIAVVQKNLAKSGLLQKFSFRRKISAMVKWGE